MKKSEKDPAHEKEKMMIDANNRIERICGGDTEYLRWLPGAVPGIAVAIADSSALISSSSTIATLPLPVVETLLNLFVAEHRHAYTMWQHREELQLLSRPAPTV